MEYSAGDKEVAAQKICLGCIVSFPHILNDRFFNTFDSKCFSPEWEEVFLICKKLHAETGELTYVSLATETGLEISKVVSLEFLFDQILPDKSKWKTYFEVIIRLKQRRDIVGILERYRAMLAQHVNIKEIIPALTQDVLGLRYEGDSSFSHSPSIMSALESNSSHVFLGIPAVDRNMEHLGSGKLIVVGGRPGWGKSICAQQSINAHSGAGYNSCLFSFEMSQKEVDRRLFSISTGTPLEDVKDGNFVDKGELNRIYQNFWIFDQSDDIDCFAVCNRIETLHEKHSIKSVFIDYLQLAVTGGHDRRGSLSAYSRALKKMASRTGINAFLLVQLNKSCITEQRDPRMGSDIFECDNIYHDADMAIAIYPNGGDRDGASIRKVGDSYVPTSVFDCQKYRDGKVFREVIANDFDRVRFLPVENHEN